MVTEKPAAAAGATHAIAIRIATMAAIPNNLQRKQKILDNGSGKIIGDTLSHRAANRISTIKLNRLATFDHEIFPGFVC